MNLLHQITQAIQGRKLLCYIKTSSPYEKTIKGTDHVIITSFNEEEVTPLQRTWQKPKILPTMKLVDKFCFVYNYLTFATHKKPVLSTMMFCFIVQDSWFLSPDAYISTIVSIYLHVDCTSYVALLYFWCPDLAGLIVPIYTFVLLVLCECITPSFHPKFCPFI